MNELVYCGDHEGPRERLRLPVLLLLLLPCPPALMPSFPHVLMLSCRHLLRDSLMTSCPRSLVPVCALGCIASRRENLDPSRLCSDAQLWEVLRRCHVASAVSHMGGLDAELGSMSGAGNSRGSLSLGQKQLLCLARVLLQGQVKVRAWERGIELGV